MMGQIGYGYGSEWHLLRWMGRHRSELDRQVLEHLGGKAKAIEWNDFKFAPGYKWPDKWPDRELLGMEFLEGTKHAKALPHWKEFWPHGSGIHNWDAVGWVVCKGGAKELLLVEAKAERKEIKSNCGATAKRSLEMIEAAFEETKSALNVKPERDWKNEYYQMTNRIAALWFLRKRKIPAHLLNIYFCGDIPKPGRESPRSEAEWKKVLKEQDKHIGLPRNHPLKDCMHKFFLPIALG
ncbi:hypothetical protein ACFL34_00535 [Candidatus Sumerlaeota bacterium]